MTVIGTPLPRPDGMDKVTGRAKYAADHHPPGLLHAVLVTSTIPAGRIVSIDTTRACALPGIARILLHQEMPRLATAPSPPLASRFMPMQSDEVRHEGQPVAMVLGETLEAAEEGARLVEVKYQPAPFIMPATDREHTEVPSKDSGYIFDDTSFAKGNAEIGLRDAAFLHEARYVQPSRHHNPMEPSATVATWEAGKLTVIDAAQHCYGVQAVLASVFGLNPEAVRVLAPHTGGGFGCKGFIWPHEVLAAAAAQVTGRPVKLVLSRAQMYTSVGYQPLIRQTVALGADHDGSLTGLRHDAANITGISDDFVEFATAASRALYATPAMALSQRIERCNLNLPTAMRAPVEGPGTWALESAMDELAARLDMDPLDFRIRNYAEVDPANGKPWSSKKLREAYEEGARLFGWRERARTAKREGHWLVGYGMASCTMGTFRFPSVARVRLYADGSAIVESGYQDIGTGTSTIIPQIAADVLGMDPGRIMTRMGDTALPQAGPTYGSSTTIGVGAAVMQAAEDVRSQLARLAGLGADDMELRDGRILRRGMKDGMAIADAMRAAGIGELIGNGSFSLPGDAPFDADGKVTPFAIRTFGAIFVEVGVDPALGLMRLRRAVGSYSAGRIINPRTARAQMIGGIIWGWGKAAMEASVHEQRLGRWLSKNLSGVPIPVNADIPSDITIHFVDEFDPHAGPLGAKGIGELGATGVAAAVANAVFDATGKRVRALPILPERLLG